VCDVFVTKLDASGNLLWARKMGGIEDDKGLAIAIDAGANVYITGTFENTADFDPGAGFAYLGSVNNEDIFVCKLNSSGNYVWAKSMGSTNSDYGQGIAVDASGNVYTTGMFSGTADFDPGAATATLTTVSANVFICKFNSSGNYVWAKQVGGSGNDSGESITVDASGNAFITGSFLLTADFDPGPATANLVSAGLQDVFILKLDASGNYVWAKNIGGASYDYANATILDASGNIYTIGSFSSTSDFDPNAGTAIHTSSGSYDVFINKLNSTGNYLWSKSFGGINSDAGRALALDAAGNLHVTGTFSGTADFDPGAGTYTLVSTTPNSDVFVSKFDATGNFLWAKNYGGGGNDNVCSIALNASNDIYTAGDFILTPDFDPGPGTFNLTSNGNSDVFIHKMGNCSVFPGTPGPINGPSIVCLGTGPQTYSIAPVSGATSYTWSIPIGWSGSSSTNTISATPGLSGTFTVTASNFCGESAAQTLSVTISQCTGINEINSPDKSMIIYPNPFSEKITITSYQSEESIFIFNTLGELVIKTIASEHKTELDLSELSKGIYFIRIGIDTKKMVKE
jgi:hypothetical protein